MSTSFQTSELDFDTIKESLKTYLKRRPEFTDYDFEASGMSNILDVLAYNTHLNALTANFALNEAYLSSAQLRPSVISIAQTLGYDIRSKVSARANLVLSLNLSSAAIKPTTISLPAKSKFTTSVDGVSYTFQTIRNYTATNDGSGVYTFVTENGDIDIPVYEGQSKTKTFIVQEESENQVFIVPDANIDTSLVTVKVFDTFSSTSFTSYTNILNASSIDEDSTFFKILETPNGYYELSFGDGVTTGTKPTVGNKVVIEYLSTNGPDANTASTFAPVSQVTVNGVNYDIAISVSNAAHSGANRQSIESIRQNAPLSFAAQKRLVTADDYKTTILTKYSAVEDVVAWGGEDNDPPNYGVVYIGLLFEDGVSTASQTAIKNEITSTLNENLAILSIDAKFVDPEKTYLEIETQFNFNPNKTSVTQNTIESLAAAKVIDYVNTNLNSFSGTFRKSKLTSEIDALSPSILSTRVDVKVQQRLTPATIIPGNTNSQSRTYNVNFPVALAIPDDINYVIESTSFSYNGQKCRIKNALNSTKLQIVTTNNTPVVDNIGSYSPTTGKIILTGFAPGVISSGDTYIKISATPATDEVIKPLRNYYLDIDPSVSFTAATIDRQNTSVAL